MSCSIIELIELVHAIKILSSDAAATPDDNLQSLQEIRDLITTFEEAH